MIYCRHTTYLYNVLSVLCCILENGGTVMQVFFIEAERVGINLLERRIPELSLLQVDQEVSVDWTTLNETHTAGWDIKSIVFPNQHLQLASKLRKQDAANFKTHWILKCCRRTAKLSHAPSIANLLAQYISLKGRPVREHEVRRWVILAISCMAASINMICSLNHHKNCTCGTLLTFSDSSTIYLSHREALQCCQWPECDPGPEPSCLAGKPGWSGWYLGGWPPESASLSPRTAPPEAPSNPHQHYTLRIVKISPLTGTNSSFNQKTLTQEHTQNVHSFLHNSVPRIQDGLPASHVHLEYVQGIPVQAFHTLQ